MRLDSGSGLSSGCLMARANVNGDYDYALCLDADGNSYAVYEGFDVHDNYFAESLLDPAQRDGTNAMSDWNTLKMIVLGNELWFIVNDTVLGTLTYADGAPAGAAGFYTYNDDDPTAEFEFRNLLIKEVTP